MKSKRSCFNGALFFSTLRRWWPLWGLYLICLFVILAGQFGLDDGTARSWTRLVADGRIVDLSWYSLVILTAAMGVVTAMCVFSDLYTRRRVDFLCALPIRREGVWLSCFLAGLAAMAVGDVIAVAACAVLEVSMGVLNLPVLLLLFAFLLMLNLTFYGFAALCAMMTGSVVVLPFVFLVLELAASAVSLLASTVCEALVFGYASDGSLALLSPLLWIIRSKPTYGPFDDMRVAMGVDHGVVTVLGVYAAAGVVCALLGLWLYRRRAMENAGEVVAVSWLRPVFRWCMALGCGLLFACFWCVQRAGGTFCGTAAVAAWAAVFAALGAFVGWFGAQMLMMKSARVFRTGWGGACAAAMILIALVAVCGTGLMGYESYIPDPAEVESVEILWSWPGFVAEGEEAVRLAQAAHRTLIDGHGDYAKAGCGANPSRASTGQITYTLRGGGVVRRQYTLYDPIEYPAMADDIAAFEAALNCGEAYEAKKLPLTKGENKVLTAVVYYNSFKDSNESRSAELDAEQALSLYAAIEKDIDNRTVGRDELFPAATENEKYITVMYDMYETRSDPERGEYRFNYGTYFYDVTEEAVNTRAWIADNLDMN